MLNMSSFRDTYIWSLCAFSDVVPTALGVAATEFPIWLMAIVSLYLIRWTIRVRYLFGYTDSQISLSAVCMSEDILSLSI